MASYNHTQDIANTDWVVVHNLDATTVVVDVMIELNGEIQKILPMSTEITDNNSITVRFSTAQSGFVRVVA